MQLLDPDHPARQGRQTGFDSLSLRDYFAVHAMSGYMAAHAGDETTLPKRGELAAYAYQLADEMLKQRAGITD